MSQQMSQQKRVGQHSGGLRERAVRMGLDHQHGYPTDATLRVSPLEGATTPEDAIEFGDLTIGVVR